MRHGLLLARRSTTESAYKQSAGVLPAADVSVTNNNTGTVASSGTTPQTAQASEVVLSVLATGLANTATITPPSSPWTQRASFISGSFGSISVAGQIASSTGTFTDSWTLSTSSQWAAMIQTFRGSSPAFLGVLNAGVGHSGSGGALALAINAPVGTLVVVCSRIFGTQLMSGCTDTKGNTYTLVQGALSPHVAIAYSKITTALVAGTDTIAVTTPGGNHVEVVVGYSGVTGS